MGLSPSAASSGAASAEGSAGVIVLDRTDLSDTPLAWPVVATHTLGEGVITTLVQDEVRTPDGGTMKREYLRHPGAVSIVALDDAERVVLVRQYRHPVRYRLLEPPAGLLDVTNEEPLYAAQRELAEEVGLAAGRWDVLVDVFSTPGIIAEKLRIFLARDLVDTDAPEGFAREGEEAHMDTVRAPLADLVDAVLAGDLHNPSLVSGVLAAWAAKQRGWRGLRPAEVPWPVG